MRCKDMPVLDTATGCVSERLIVVAGLLQLALNGLAMLNIAQVGCAGFNKVLGPWRTEMRSVHTQSPPQLGSQ